MKISKLEIENVKRVKAVSLEPTQNGLTVIGGRNNQSYGRCSEHYSRAETEDCIIPLVG